MNDRNRRTGWLVPLVAASVAAGCQMAPASLAPATTAPSTSLYHVAGTNSTRYLISLKGEDIPSTLATSVKAAGGSLVSSLPGMGVAVADSSKADFASTLAGDTTVESVGPMSGQQLSSNVYAQSFSLTADGPDASGASGEPLSGYQWGLQTTHVPEAWAQGLTGKGVKVAVLDTGIDTKNDDLTPNLDLANSKSFVASEPSIVDYNGHGSHVAGTIAAAINGYGIAGVAPQATLLAVKVLNSDGYGEDADILAGMKYAVDQGARVLNLSLEGPSDGQAQTNAYRHAVRYAKQHGAVVVAAAGNESGSPKTLEAYLLPAELEACIAVSSVGPQNQQNFDAFSLFSNYGSYVDVAAPGGNIGYDASTGTPILYTKRDFVLSTWSTQAKTYTQNGFKFTKASHMFLAGTSMSTPHVAGTLALMLQAHPEYSAAQLRQQLVNSADDLGKPGRDPYYGQGRLNAGRAVL